MFNLNIQKMENNATGKSINSPLFLVILIVLPLAAFSQNKDNHIFIDSLFQLSEITTNSPGSDFGPAIVQDSLYFTTYIDHPYGKRVHKTGNIEFYKMYKSVIDSHGNTIGERMPLTPFITQFNEGPVAWCEKTGELFITVNYPDQSLKSKKYLHEVNRLKIVIAKRMNGKWKQISEFPYNNPQYSVGHPAVTQSGDTLVFSSDKPGGFGETDLYYSVRKNGNWDNPVNLGAKINTTGKEEFAAFTDQSYNGKFLVFSSSGRFGMGGLDLYYTRFPSDYKDIVHFESPINSPSDDFAMTIPKDADYGYLTSNRPGTGDDHIYKFTLKKRGKPQKCITINVIDQTSRHPISDVMIEGCDHKFYTTDKDGKVACFPFTGKQCEVTASTFGYQGKTKILRQNYLPGEDIACDTIWMEIAVNKKIALKNIYFDFNKWDILPESVKELNRLVALMQENPGMNVVLSSHTDDRGTEIYNLKLSQLRAEASVNYVVSNGINHSRITGMGYGKSQLIHKSASGIKLTPEQNRENRRTEIFIPGFIRGESVKQKQGDYSIDKQVFSADSAPSKKEGRYENKANKSSEDISVTKSIVLLGAFADLKIATELVQKLKSEGKKARILTDNSKLYRVGIEYPDIIEARKALGNLKKTYKDAWVLQK
jgi:outer membrane protein OmpA-like peptidoglycan-associated protein